MDGRTTIEIHIGTTVFNYEGDLSRIDMRKFETEPTDMTIAMTQASYDLRFNKVYLLYLSKNTNETGTETGFNPRTGPYSIGWITKDSKLVKNDKGRREIVSNKYISMGAGGGSWAKKIPLDDYLKNLKVTE